MKMEKRFQTTNNSSLSTCPLREEKSFSQRFFSIYTDIRKLQDKAKTSYTLSTRRLRFGYEQQFSRSTPGACFGVVGEELTAYRFPHLQENRHRMSTRVLSRAIVQFCLKGQSLYLLVLFSPYLLHRRQ